MQPMVKDPVANVRAMALGFENYKLAAYFQKTKRSVKDVGLQ